MTIIASEAAARVALRFIRFLENSEECSGLFSAQAFCDFTLPRWRLQAAGEAEVIALRRRGHPEPSKVSHTRCDPTPTGFVLELTEEWESAGERWYCRELFRADVVDDRISALSVYCTGDWDRARRAQHAREVRLLRD